MSTLAPPPRSARRRASRSVVTAVVAALAVLLAVVGLSSPVSAANNPGIVVSIAELQKADANGNVSDGFVRVGDVVKMSLTWDATGVVLAEGDSFTIELGPSLEAREPRSFPLTRTPHAGAVGAAHAGADREPDGDRAAYRHRLCELEARYAQGHAGRDRCLRARSRPGGGCRSRCRGSSGAQAPPVSAVPGAGN